MTDELLTSIEKQSVKVSMTRRQARIFFDIIDKALKEEENVFGTTNRIERLLHADVAATDLQGIHESLYFDAGLGEEQEDEV